MRLSTSAGLLVYTILAEAQSASSLVGTWSTKSNATLAGPSFYNTTIDRLIEPSHPGISYSFTEDGHYEVAYYRAVSDPIRPECPSAIMQWQHGEYTLSSDGHLSLTPYGPDGRQLLSAPCQSKKSIYSRYNQSEEFRKFSVYKDPYHKIQRLDLYQSDGAPLQPLYLASNPPQMNPTSTLNLPKTSSTSAARKLKRSLEDIALVGEHRTPWVDERSVWWFGLGMTGFGSVLYFCF